MKSDLFPPAPANRNYPSWVSIISILSAESRYFVTAAPQCVYPDANLGEVLGASDFDAVYVQFCEHLFYTPPMSTF